MPCAMEGLKGHLVEQMDGQLHSQNHHSANILAAIFGVLNVQVLTGPAIAHQVWEQTVLSLLWQGR